MGEQFQYIQVSYVDAIAGDDLNFKKELIDIFSEQIADFVPNLRRFLDTKNWEQLAKEAHTAKSSAMTFGMDETADILKQIQRECEANKVEKMNQLVSKAIEQLEGADLELDRLKKSL